MPPKNIAGPVVRGDDLWGRNEDVAELWSQVQKGSVLLAGPRRYGKSSLMYAVKDRPRRGWQAISLHVEYVESPQELLVELTAKLVALGILGTADDLKAQAGVFGRWLGRIVDAEAGATIPAIGEVKIRLREGLDGEWRPLAEETLGRLGRLDQDLLIILDEFPVMVGHFLDRSEEDGLSFLRWFRTQRHQDAGAHQVRWLLGGSVNIEPRLMKLGRSELFNDLQRAHVRPMGPVEAAAFVRAVLEGENAAFDGAVPDAIVATCGASVHFFLQVVIEQCLAVARRSGGTLTVEHVQPAYEEHVLGPESRARFDHYRSRLAEYYGDLEDAARVVLGHMAGTDTGSATLTSLRDLFEPNELTDAQFADLLIQLEGDYYIEQDANTARFKSAFLLDWWLRNVPWRGR